MQVIFQRRVWGGGCLGSWRSRTLDGICLGLSRLAHQHDGQSRAADSE